MALQWRIISLGKIRTGEKVYINSINLDKEMQRKLYDMGIIPGKEIKVLRGDLNHPYLIKSNSTQIMLDWDCVKAIKVKLGD